MAKNLFDAVYGSLIAGAVGDALGAPVEGMQYNEIREKYGKMTDLINNPVYYTNHMPGAVTDDTQMRHIICKAIADKQGRILPAEMAKAMMEKLNPEKVWISDVLALERLKCGISEWESGKGAIPCGCASMGIAPAGIINAGDPEQAYQDGYCLASVHNTGENVEFAASFAAAQAAAFLPDVTQDAIIKVIYRYSTDIVRRAFDLTMDIAYGCSDLDQFTEKFYDKMLDWTWPLRPGTWNKHKFFSGNSREFMPVVFAIMHYTPELNQALIDGASFGRDCDTISSMVGNIAGTIAGASALRQDWIEQCTKANEDMFIYVDGDAKCDFADMARRLVKSLENERSKAEMRAHWLGKVLKY